MAQRASFMTEFLQREVQGFLRLAQPPAATSRFLDLGTDSLMAVELRNRLHSQFGGAFTISATAVFDYPTIGGLAEYLAGSAAGGGLRGGRGAIRCSARVGSGRKPSRREASESNAAPAEDGIGCDADTSPS